MLNTNRKQREKSANKDLALKIALEASLYRQLNVEFANYSKQFKKILAETSTIHPVDDLQSSLNKTLLSHYNKVANRFSIRIAEELGTPDNHSDILKTINGKTATHHAGRALQQSQKIAETILKEAHQSLLEANQQAQQQGKILLGKELAALAALKLLQKNKARLNTITITETQNPAEHAKQTEAEVLVASQYLDIHKVTKEKDWNAILDSRTRDAHAEADGQIVEYDEPYTVMGQQLMYPGDTSMGATADNIIGCRCSSVLIIR